MPGMSNFSGVSTGREAPSTTVHVAEVTKALSAFFHSFGC